MRTIKQNIFRAEIKALLNDRLNHQHHVETLRSTCYHPDSNIEMQEYEVIASADLNQSEAKTLNGLIAICDYQFN